MLTFKVIKIDSSRTSLSDAEGKDLIRRLFELGLHPGIEIQIVDKISFGSVTIIQYGQTRLALNEEEFKCLHGL